MDNYQSHLLYAALNNLIGRLTGVFQCTESDLERLVQEQVITSEERYLVFSYPSACFFNAECRWNRLLQVLRDRRALISLLQFFSNPDTWIPGIEELIEVIRRQFLRHPTLRRFTNHF
jgi:hypothetical protein